MNLSQLLDKEQISIGDDVKINLEKFASILHDWNQTHNLTGAKTVEAIYENIIDSIYPVKFIDAPGSLLDVGTGAGFPGLALAIVWSKTVTTLCEPLNKRASFLKYVAMELGIDNVSVLKQRVESLRAEPFALISSRAVTDTQLLLKLTADISSSQTEYLFYKGSNVLEEIKSSEQQLNYDIVSRDKRNYLWIKK